MEMPNTKKSRLRKVADFFSVLEQPATPANQYGGWEGPTRLVGKMREKFKDPNPGRTKGLKDVIAQYMEQGKMDEANKLIQETGYRAISRYHHANWFPKFGLNYRGELLPGKTMADVDRLHAEFQKNKKSDAYEAAKKLYEFGKNSYIPTKIGGWKGLNHSLYEVASGLDRNLYKVAAPVARTLAKGVEKGSKKVFEYVKDRKGGKSDWGEFYCRGGFTETPSPQERATQVQAQPLQIAYVMVPMVIGGQVPYGNPAVGMGTQNYFFRN